jgi:Type-1V conjugative transfer system mating pair stabilisation
MKLLGFVLIQVCLIAGALGGSDVSTSYHTLGYNTLGRQKAEELRACVKANRAKAVPGYKTFTPPQTQFQNYQKLEEAGQTQAFSDPTAAFLKQSAQTRPFFALDSQKDPVILQAKEAVLNAEAFLSQGVFENREQPTFEEVVCEESKPETVYSCTKTLVEPTIHIEPAKYSHFWCGVAKHRPDDPVCTAKVRYDPARMYEPERVTVTDNRWSSTCQQLEALADAGICEQIAQTCPRGEETRDVVAEVLAGGKSISRPITQPCWQWQVRYRCTHPSKNTCERLRKASCEQIGSTCIKKLEKVCVVWRQRFRCFKKPGSLTPVRERLPITLEVPHPRASDKPNQEMQDALAKLSILREVQEDLRASQAKEVLPQIFKGSCKRCTIAFAGFSDCCGKAGGWGHGLGLTGCSGEERDLAERRARGLCVAIGVYCAEKLLGMCIRKKRSYCCFPSKLARILHEQGRVQVGMAWGTAEVPNCEGFCPDQLASLNFDTLNMGELYKDLQSQMKQPVASVVQRNLKRNVQEIAKSLQNPPRQGDY